VLSREPSSLWPPSPSRNPPAPRRLTRMPHSPGLDRSNDGQDHTVLPYARLAISPQFSQPCRRSRKLTDETNLAAPLVGTQPWAHGEQSALPLASRTRTLPRPPQARLANVTTTRSPLKDEPGWPTHTPFPNFGKAEYFCAYGLTEGQHRRGRVDGVIGRPPARSTLTPSGCPASTGRPRSSPPRSRLASGFRRRASAGWPRHAP